ncbi:MAG: metallophosphoesterase [Chitinophagales bacterium]|nr:metallophosphoesterase [Chitinophagales bacterium]
MLRFLIFYSIVTGLVLLIDIYAFQAVRSSSSELSPSAKRIINIIYWSLTVLTLASLTTVLFFPFDKWPTALRMYLFSFIMLIYLTKIVVLPFVFFDDILRGIAWITRFFADKPADGSPLPPITRSKFIGQLAMVAGGIPLALGINGILRNAYNYKIHRVKVALPHLPESFNGLKIVQISDVHSGSFVSRSQVERGIEMINKENADLVFFTGDIVNYRAEEMLAFSDVFEKIRAKEGVYSIFGNHDYADYVRWSPGEEESGKAANRKLLSEIHKGMGWSLLLNENRILRRGNDTLAIIGSENWSNSGRFHTYGNMSKACAGCETADVKLLLSHDPSHWEGEILKQYPDIDIQFAGHTHGAQLGVEIPGFIKWSPSQYLYKQWAGLYQEGKQYLYVNRGFGFIGFHGRIGILPEITVMELVKA